MLKKIAKYYISFLSFTTIYSQHNTVEVPVDISKYFVDVGIYIQNSMNNYGQKQAKTPSRK